MLLIMVCFFNSIAKYLVEDFFILILAVVEFLAAHRPSLDAVWLRIFAFMFI